MKTVFLGNISHALRTPLNAIIGFSDVLDAADGGEAIPKEDRHQLLQLINSNGNQLLHFINQLLELSEIESSNAPLEYSDVDVKETMASYIDECRRDAADGVELLLEGSEMTVKVNERYMRAVTKHFLSNAIHHTRKGSITLRYRLEKNGLRTEVQDTGDGLPEALRENIFSLLSEKATFVQNEVPGLGLTVCRAIVERCGGIIGAVSPEEGGTILWYWMPVRNIRKKDNNTHKK